MWKELAGALSLAGMIALGGLILVGWGGRELAVAGRLVPWWPVDAVLALALAGAAGWARRGQAPAPPRAAARAGAGAATGVALEPGGRQAVPVQGGASYLNRVRVRNDTAGPLTGVTVEVVALEGHAGHGLPVRLACPAELLPAREAVLDVIQEEFTAGRHVRNFPHYVRSVEPVGIHFETPPAAYGLTLALAARELPRPFRARFAVAWEPGASAWRLRREGADGPIS